MKIFHVKRTDIDFSGDDIHRFLPWLIGVMACLTTLLLCLTISVGSWIVNRNDDYANSFTVNVPAAAKSNENIQAIRTVLLETNGIVSVTQLSEDDLQRSLKSWLGNSDVSSLPMPAVLEVSVSDNSALDIASLKTKLTAVTPEIEVETYEEWIAAFSNFSAVIQFVMITLALIIIIAMGGAVIFTSRTALKLHARTVALLHSIGAEDDYITRQFQQDAFLLVLPGLVIGTVAAGVLYGASGAYIAAMPASVFPSLNLTMLHMLLFVALPAICSIGATLVARMAVTKQLKRTL